MKIKGIWRKYCRPIVGMAVAGFLLIGVSSALAYENGFNLAGCRHDGIITLPIAGQFVCPDPSFYYNANLLKGWNELDYVPHRVTLVNAKNYPLDYIFIVAGDYMAKENTALGWDGISPLTLNPDLGDWPGKDDPTPVPNPCPPNPTPGDPLATLMRTSTDAIPDPPTNPGGGVGGAYETIYRVVEMVQHPANTTCVYDYYQRLAVGSHEFSGSSLQSNLWNDSLTSSGIGQKRISIPVKDILPQEIGKSMDGTLDQEQLWTINKAGPSDIHFANTCPGDPQETEVQLTVTWVKEEITPAGDINVTVQITATNPASRSVDIIVYDEVKSGGDILDNFSCGPETIPAGSNGFIVCTEKFTISSDEVNVYDVATAEYYDTYCQVPIDQTVETTADLNLQDGVIINEQIKVKEEEFFTDMSDNKYVAGAYTGAISYSIDDVSGANGSFASYMGGWTQDPVEWTSEIQTDSGQVVFTKTIRVDAVTQESLKLADVAMLLTEQGDPLDPVTQGDFEFVIQCEAQVKLQIDKTIPALISPITIDFTVKAPGDVPVATRSITFNPDETHNLSTWIEGLEPGVTYTVIENTPSIFTSDSPVTKKIDLPLCEGTAPIVNLFNADVKPRVQVKKLTIPAGHEAGWDFTLYKVVSGGPDIPVAQLTSDDANYKFFTDGIGLHLRLDYDESYYVKETPQGGWDHTGTMLDGVPLAVGNCGFDVDTDDEGHIFQCAFENTQRGKIIVEKQTDPDGVSASFDFVSTYGDPFSLMDNGTNDSGWLQPGDYDVAELEKTGWKLTDVTCNDGDSNTIVGNRVAHVKLSPGEIVTCTFYNEELGTVIIHKRTALPGGTGFDFGDNIESPNSFTLDDYGMKTFTLVEAGQYGVTELDPAPDWKLVNVECTDTDEGGTDSTGNVAARSAVINLDPGETVECTFWNEEQGYFDFLKQYDGTDQIPPNPWNFTLNGPGVSESRTVPPASPDFTSVRLDLEEVYTFCEENLQPGETTEWYYSGDPTMLPYVGCESNVTDLLQVYDPDPNCGMVGAVNDTRCVDFMVVDPGATAFIRINNVPPPGGDQRTIGYWKNWNTCSGGNQQYQDGAYLLDYALPQLLGNLEIGVCADGRNIVDKRTICEPYANLAGDAAYGLAAQLLGAKANIAAQAGTCSEMWDAIVAADDLLARIGFDGCGLCLPSDVGTGDPRVMKVRDKVTKTRGTLDWVCTGATQEDREEALGLAETLDDYNNGFLCP